VIEVFFREAAPVVISGTEKKGPSWLFWGKQGATPQAYALGCASSGALDVLIASSEVMFINLSRKRD